ncbi:MAG: hypothetical protein ABI693_17190 [Bryobacteraceae bacterium]
MLRTSVRTTILLAGLAVAASTPTCERSGPNCEMCAPLTSAIDAAKAHQGTSTLRINGGLLSAGNTRGLNTVFADRYSRGQWSPVRVRHTAYDTGGVPVGLRNEIPDPPAYIWWDNFTMAEVP